MAGTIKNNSGTWIIKYAMTKYYAPFAFIHLLPMKRVFLEMSQQLSQSYYLPVICYISGMCYDNKYMNYIFTTKIFYWVTYMYEIFIKIGYPAAT
jgi:hypothetical protein